MEPVRIQLYSSLCGRNEYYLKRVEDMARRLGLRCTLERVTDEDELERAGVDLDCLMGYCPGCRPKHTEYPKGIRDGVCAPALAINGAIVFGDYPPDDETLERILRAYLPAAGREDAPLTGALHNE